MATQSKQDLETILGVKELQEPNFWRQVLAELVGTFLLVLIGVGSTLPTTPPDPSATAVNVQVALTFGFIVAALALVFGDVSGCHLNPAVSVGLFFYNQTNLTKVIVFGATQCAGSILAAWVIRLLVPDKLTELNIGVTNVTSITAVQGVCIEFIVSFTLVTVVTCLSQRKNDGNVAAPIIVGLVITALCLFAGPWTGASINPARSLGPAVINNFWDNQWVYWVGPLCGGAVAGLTYRFLFKTRVNLTVPAPQIPIRRRY